jgi:hypothetical protein
MKWKFMADFIAVSFGGGTNSTALLCGFLERDMRPDLITFADTGAEQPHTYSHLSEMQELVKRWWGLNITLCRKLYKGEFEGLEGQCNRHKQMPSLAYGKRSCSQKYKHQPQAQVLKAAMRAADVAFAINAIGFDAGESHRIKTEHLEVQALTQKLRVQNRYFLVEWGWRRQECVEAIKRHGLTQPGKSSCFFCPAMKKREVFQLRDEQPDLLARALKIEDQAQKTNRTKRGLGGDGNLWREWLDQDERQAKLFDWIEPYHVPCGCYDG